MTILIFLHIRMCILGQKGDVLYRLTTSRQYIQDVLGQIKTEMELSECTFSPNINPVSAAMKTTDPVHVRLAQEAERRKEELRY